MERTSMGYGPYIYDNVAECAPRGSYGSPEAVLRGAVDVSAGKLVCLEDGRGAAGGDLVVRSEKLMDDVILGSAGIGHLENGTDECAEACGAVYLYFRLGGVSVSGTETEGNKERTGFRVGLGAGGAVGGAWRMFRRRGTMPMMWSAEWGVRLGREMEKRRVCTVHMSDKKLGELA